MMQEYQNMVCPKCHSNFGPEYDVPLYLSHVKECFKGKKKQKKEQFEFVKTPIDNTMTKFKWEKKQRKAVNLAISGWTKEQVKGLSFQQKQFWLRNKLESLRISWQNGADYIKLDKSNILMGSLVEVQKVDMHKQVKIEFIGQKVNDAGGLLRQWVHMVVKQIFDFNTGIFIFANTDDTMYRLKWDDQMDEYFSVQLLTLLGLIIGKAIFQRIPLTCFLDRSILRQICNQAVKFQDIYGYDIQLYKNWKYALQAEDVSDLHMNFVTIKNNGGTMQQIELLEGHKQIEVNNDNIKLYIDLCIQAHTMTHVARSIKSIIQGINKVFPCQWLEIFQPYELQMILYGVPFIDLQDWYDNTQYKQPYNKDHQIIKWFWQVMEQFDQEQLGKVLHFCTGSTRTPIHGFSKLESNRGNYSKFLIVSTDYNKKNPFPKAHTCFNRLELPLYPNLQTLKTYITAISKNELDGIFGLD